MRRRRSGNKAMILRRSAGVKVLQAAISASVRPQPVQSADRVSITQT